MNILGYKTSHDASAAHLMDGNLEFLIEVEKDSHERYAQFSGNFMFYAQEILQSFPDVICNSGWRAAPPRDRQALYVGTGKTDYILEARKHFGQDYTYFSSTHEKSHLFSAYGMSPWPQGQPCYALIWEGGFGNFYEIDEHLNIRELGVVLPEPGFKYAFAYNVANPHRQGSNFFLDAAGKMMAIAACGDPNAPTSECEQEFLSTMMDPGTKSSKVKLHDFAKSPYYNIGVESELFKNFAKKLSDAIFDTFYQFACEKLTKGYPLLISGGCGLNCDWNTAWRDCGLFPDIFVPPVTNDTGCAIGTAIEAQHVLTGSAKIDWDCYAGEEFVFDADVSDDYTIEDLDLDQLCQLLMKGQVFGWIQGRYEIGPRALGNRSLIAAPFDASMLAKLNHIKQREGFRPIAPMCLREDVSEHFDWEGDSPYMLHFQMVKNPRLNAIKHVDGSARAQTVAQVDNPKLHKLLSQFKEHSGAGVLCNTSLNFKGKGFINRMTDMVAYQQDRKFDGFVVHDKLYRPIQPKSQVF